MLQLLLLVRVVVIGPLLLLSSSNSNIMRRTGSLIQRVAASNNNKEKHQTSPQSPHGPFILPPRPNETAANEDQAAASLWTVTSLFRQAVALGLDDDQPFTDLDRSREEVVRIERQPEFETEPEQQHPKQETAVEQRNSKNNCHNVDYCVIPKLSTKKKNNPQGTTEAPTYLPDNMLPTLRVYAAASFAKLRTLFGVSEASYRASLVESGPFVSFAAANSKGTARIGGVFFYSPDGNYLIKSIKPDEVPTLLDTLLPEYVEYMAGASGKTSLLTRFCGLYQLTTPTGHSHTLVVMNSVFPPTSPLTERYDLKGSTVGRQCSPEHVREHGSQAVLKDLDLLQRSTECHGGKEGQPYFLVGAEQKQALLRQIRKDVEFLERCSVIDYSLLVGVEPVLEEKKKKKSKNRRRLGGLFGVRDGNVMNDETAGQDTTTKPASLLSLGPLRRRRPRKSSTSATIDGGPFAVLPGTLYQASAPEKTRQDGHTVTSTTITTKPVLFYFGLIDFLQPYNAKKRVEYNVKSLVHERDTFSCVPPSTYANRLVEFLDQYIG